MSEEYGYNAECKRMMKEFGITENDCELVKGMGENEEVTLSTGAVASTGSRGWNDEPDEFWLPVYIDHECVTSNYIYYG